jgi:CheY-like chemotaxis protein
VFEAFTQGKETVSRCSGGTGLGLTISKTLVEMLGGKLSVESELGRGSTFQFTLPTGPLDGIEMQDGVQGMFPSPAQQQSSTECVRIPAKLSARILLCEDGLDNQRLIAFLLTRAGAEVVLADNGQIGLEKALAAEETGQPFDVILMDMQMPVLDGYLATRSLRENAYLGPIIALTAYAMAGDREECLDAGCDDYISKPIDKTTLLAMIAGCLPNAREQPERPLLGTEDRSLSM